MSHDHQFKPTNRSEWRASEAQPRRVQKCACGAERLGDCEPCWGSAALSDGPPVPLDEYGSARPVTPDQLRQAELEGLALERGEGEDDAGE